MKRIASRDNAFFKHLKKLAQSARERANSGETLLDGAHLIRACRAAGRSPGTLVVDEAQQEAPEIAALLAESAASEVVLLPTALYRDAAVVETPSGIMAVLPLPPAASPDPFADAVLLDGVQDPGNVGTLLRTAAAAGFRQVLLSPDCAGVWSPRVLRAGQGAHFLLDLVEDADLPAFLQGYRGQAAVTSLRDAVSLYAADLRGPLAWVFGSEGQGVRPQVAAQAPLKITIPMPGAVESLNVGAAAAVCLFETVRQRLSG